MIENRKETGRKSDGLQPKRQDTTPRYLIGIDQSTQGTKAILLDDFGRLLMRTDLSHRQIISEKGWVSHDPEEIYANTIRGVETLLEKAQIPAEQIAGVGISNQRETSMIWEKESGRPMADAVVWQCARAEEICARPEVEAHADEIYEKTGLKLSPYFPAAKFAWLLEHTEGAKEKEAAGELCMGTMDVWLVYKLTGGLSYKTDYSNASRTQLFHLSELKWDEKICGLFGIHTSSLPVVCDSDSCFGMTDFGGLLPHPVPIHGMLGDSHAALFGQGCLLPGTGKATYGTGSSIMMNTGDTPIRSKNGLVSSIGWKLGGKLVYVLEGNINYTGAAISWLKDQVRLIDSAGETEHLCRAAAKDDDLYFVPAFTGLGAPYWNSACRGSLSGIGRTTGREEIIRACVESIAYQIRDVVDAMGADAGICPESLRVDGGPTKNTYLMQFQSDMLGSEVLVSDSEEMSAIGAACAAGIVLGILPADVTEQIKRMAYHPQMDEELRIKKWNGWKRAVVSIL